MIICFKQRHDDELECTETDNKPCSSLPYPCISCRMNTTCVYGNQTIANCTANVDCVVWINNLFLII